MLNQGKYKQQEEFIMTERYKAARSYYTEHPDFKATLTTLSPDVQIFDWKRPNTGVYSVHAVFDRNRVYITGDLGSAVVELTEKATLETLSEYYQIPEYFVEKIQCATDMYSYDLDEAKEELESRLKRIMGDFRTKNPGNAAAARDVQTELNEIRRALINSATPSGGLLEDCVAARRLCKYDPHVEEWLFYAGRVVATRVLLWLAAFELAQEYIDTHSQEV